MTEPLNYYSPIILSSNMEKGLVAGNGTFPEGTLVEIAAVSMVGNRFVEWQAGNTESPRPMALGQEMTFPASFETSTQSIDVSESASHCIYTRGSQIVVENAENLRVRIFDVVGRCFSVAEMAGYCTIFNMHTLGTYFIQVYNHPDQSILLFRNDVTPR